MTPHTSSLPDTAPASLPASPVTPFAAPHPAYRADIDGLRALAVLSVVLYHAFPARLPGGFAGVDIFFVISGFLIGSILIAGIEQGSFRFADFYVRRVRRIFPALILVLAATMLFGWFALFPDEYKMLGTHVLAGAGFFSNFFLWSEVGYFDTAADTKPLLHLWSLGIEEQFYIVWPVLMWLAWRRGVSVLTLALSVLVLSFAINLAGVHKFPSATFYSPASRVWEMLFGTVLAYLSVHRIRLFIGARRDGHDHAGASEHTTLFELGSAQVRNVASVAGLLLIVAALALLRADRHFPGGWALLPVLGATLLIAAGPQALCNRLLLSNRVAVWLGLISYPLYLWHWPLLAFARIVESGLPSAKVRGCAVLAAVVLAWLTYRLVERPLRGARNGRIKVAVLAAAMLALVAVAAAIYAGNGWPQRASVVDNALQQQDLVIVEDKANAAACKQRYGFASLYEYCLLDQPARDPTVLLIGDSHGYHLVAGLTRYYRSQGENLWYLGTRTPFLGMPDRGDGYQKATPMMLKLALETPGIKTVIVSTNVKLYTYNADGVALVAAMRETVRQLLAAGREVILVYDAPALDFEPRGCLRRAGVASSRTNIDCAMPRAVFDQNVAAHKPAWDALLKEFPQVQVFDTAAPLCDAKRCHAMIGTTLMYRDNHHLSYRGDLYMGELFARQQLARQGK
ncbi:UNVERIFIED_ORG: peptidoglycan/LPS O-acetylase OafA/YrhL [Zoogloea ramigera]|uniref:Acyltransferase family protein n=1 Tax=Duganella zoogloeoides TaxID=75659 RepID=A0ABZ0XZZ3_9BURK|nr:acyltransferase family protein [Duganella zoogloeoides]WQH05353.1 acyltransferase family protein [Duganella zoogloeoides]